MSSSDDKVETAALVISLVALIGTFLQVVQQYLASATGYANCRKSLKGGWYDTVHRKLQLKELRFEVQFETPVIFVCPQTNDRGPMDKPELGLKVPISFLDGTKDSMKKARLLTQEEQNAQQRDALQHSRIHTADNEKATWLTLLEEIQSMERANMNWVTEHRQKSGPGAVAGFKEHTLVVALQPKPRSWDNMPAGVKKPYATTTICHIVEIASMLGIYWKEFDRSRDKYRAEGNGFMLTGSTVPDLGLTFTFQICGKARFQENRIIPLDEIKELCFGYVRTIFYTAKDNRRLGAKDDNELQFGSMREIAETMVQLECNTSTANYFKTKDARHQHLFAVPFEIIGMLGQSLYMKNSYHRMLPNPTPYHWDRRFFDLPRLIKEFSTRFDKEKYMTPSPDTPDLKKLISQVLEQLETDRRDVATRQKERDTEIAAEEEKKKKDKEDKENEGHEKKKDVEISSDVPSEGGVIGPLKRSLTRKRTRPSWLIEYKASSPPKAEERPKKDYTPILPGYNLPLLTCLHDAIQECDKYLKTRERDLLTMVVREHIQEVLRMINEPEPEESTKSTTTGDTGDDSSQKAGKTVTAFFDVLSAANPEDRQGIFMKVYFEHVLPCVSDRAVKAYDKRKRMKNINHRSYTLAQQTQNSDISGLEMAPAGPDSTATTSTPSTSTVGQSPVLPTTPALASKKLIEAQAIWCTLIFRMLCWLQLHDFDKQDIQFPKSELRGNRLPVYIS
ncbi:hypothetical protein NEUTE1DRAFT_148405 [Neurospora tetrasperma FGSC 2508]|uniref:Modin n=1 Tax=Neurospora tetrasperma (strain FGSC 2508 / ATCC MYA-4615 / P0657) TaxID=510951 RepID=F8MVG5_NEUT8|nr:uncharacterized protein NEUTE1DRAFT_148405 [Neurospora tetrasperma FGSC 2508]EGO53917.1 hypothetical protein NEUTE1DRAFT_148405 [Neurospora tetrasperma FGSC 2508]EGZ68670.1 hypothetical protein NEUTE2DRAFT_153009 [Neurospora tetrasperma FGSC 2509]